MDRYILALDQGTTGTTVSLVNQKGEMVGTVNTEHPQIYPKPGWVEHDPESIWRSVLQGIQKTLELAKVSSTQLAALGITNQRETIIAWDKKTGQPLYNAIVWQCRRTTEYCNSLKKQPRLVRLIKNKTGLVLDPYFSASKIRWLLKNVPEAKRLAKNQQLAVGTIDSFLIWRLSGGMAHKTDVSNASRTQLMNIQTGQWDPELCRLFSVPAHILPEIVDSSGPAAFVKNIAGLPDGLPIAGLAGDQQAALFGQACFSPGAVKCTFGTGSFVLMNTGTKRLNSKFKLLTTVAWRLRGEKKLTYALEGGAFICGAAVQWLRDEMKMIAKSSDIEDLAKQVPDTGGVFLVPAFVGLGAPYWDPDARAAIVGLTRGSGRAHLARATLEAMALQNVDILNAMEKDLGAPLGQVRVDGGAVSNNLLLQMQADFLGKKVGRPKRIESTVLGAAFLAGLGVGFWSSTAEIKKLWSQESIFSPKLNAKARQHHLAAWRQAVGRVRSR